MKKLEFNMLTSILKYLPIAGISFLFSSCGELEETYSDDDCFVTSDAYSITSNSAVISGNISTFGGSVDVYYSVSEKITGSECEYKDGMARDYQYTIKLYGLQPKTKYYYQAYYNGAKSGVSCFTTK